MAGDLKRRKKIEFYVVDTWKGSDLKNG